MTYFLGRWALFSIRIRGVYRYSLLLSIGLVVAVAYKMS
jgi:hypothetical protein